MEVEWQDVVVFWSVGEQAEGVEALLRKFGLRGRTTGSLNDLPDFDRRRIFHPRSRLPAAQVQREKARGKASGQPASRVRIGHVGAFR